MRFLALACLIALGADTLMAGVTTWTGGSQWYGLALFDDPLNWDNGVPTAGDAAYFDSDYIALMRNDAAMLSLQVGSEIVVSGNMSVGSLHMVRGGRFVSARDTNTYVNAGSVIIDSGAVFVGEASNDGEPNVFGSMDVYGSLIAGFRATNRMPGMEYRANLLVNSGAVVNLHAGGVLATCNVTNQMTGFTVNNNGGIHFDQTGNPVTGYGNISDTVLDFNLMWGDIMPVGSTATIDMERSLVRFSVLNGGTFNLGNAAMLVSDTTIGGGTYAVGSGSVLIAESISGSTVNRNGGLVLAQGYANTSGYGALDLFQLNKARVDALDIAGAFPSGSTAVIDVSGDGQVRLNGAVAGGTWRVDDLAQLTLDDVTGAVSFEIGQRGLLEVGSLDNAASVTVGSGGIFVGAEPSSAGFSGTGFRSINGTAQGTGLLLASFRMSADGVFGAGVYSFTVGEGGLLQILGNAFDGGQLSVIDGGRVNFAATNAMDSGAVFLGSGASAQINAYAGVSDGTLDIAQGAQVDVPIAYGITGGHIVLDGSLGFEWGIAVDSLAGSSSGSLAGSLAGSSILFNQDVDTRFDGDISAGYVAKRGDGTLTLAGGLSLDRVQVFDDGFIGAGADGVFDGIDLELRQGGGYDSGGYDASFGTLLVREDGRILLDSSAHELTFADSSAQSWTGTLTIDGWSGDENGGDYGRVYVQGQGLTAAQRSMIQWAGGALVGAEWVGATNELRPNLSTVGGGTTLVMQTVTDNGITLVTPQSVTLPSQTVTSNGSSASIASVSETYPVGFQDLRGTSSPLTVNASVSPLAYGGTTRTTTLSVDTLTGQSSGCSTASVSTSGTLITAPAAVNRQFGAIVRVTAGALTGSNAKAGTYTGSVTLTVN